MPDDDSLFQSQGLIASDILIMRDAYESPDPYDLIQAVIDFVNWSFNSAQMVSGEFRREALWAYHVDLYLAQVNNGGHLQFLYNTQIPQPTLRNIDDGLVAMGERDFLAIFHEFLAAITSEPDLLQTINSTPAVQRHLIDTPATNAMKALDDRFYDLNGAASGAHRLIKANASWIRTLPLAILTDAEVASAAQAILSRNPRLDARQTRSAELKAEADAKDPLLVFAKALCAKAGLTFVGLTAGTYTDDPDVKVWGLRVSEGMRFARIGRADAALFMTKEDVVAKRSIAVVRIEETNLDASA